MKKMILFLAISLFLINFLSAGITASAINNNSGDRNQRDNSEIQTRTTLNSEQIGEIIREQNRIRIEDGECPEDCTCDGSKTSCKLQNGTREMTVSTGSSGNMIIQTKGVDASTNVELYRSESRVYGKFGNETREVKIFPDQVQERIRERIQARLENQTIELDNKGVYQVELRKRARLFGLFSITEKVNAEVDSETGEIIRIRNQWWGFLAVDETEESE